MLDTSSTTEPEVKEQPEVKTEAPEPTGLTKDQINENAKNRLNAVFGDEPIPETPETSTPEPEPKSEQEPDPQPVAEAEPEPESEPEPKPADTKEEPPAAEAPKLTEAEVRAAIHNGWSKDELDELVKTSPTLAKRTCEKFLENTNNLSKKFAELGKKAAEPVAPASTVTHTPKAEAFKIDMAAIEKEYEGDPIVDVLKAVVAKLESQPAPAQTITHTADEATQAVRQAQVEQDAAVAQQIELFFQAPDVAAMGEFYGAVPKESKDWDALTQGQIKNRWKVIEEANLILKGAASQGMEMPLQEAFERAHLLVTAPVREQAVRNKIKAQAVKRSRSLTLEPSSATSTTKITTKTMDTAAANAKSKLQKLFK
jgi:hypothetical protein